MRVPITRAEFERNFHLLREQIKQGRFHVAEGLGLGLEKVRFLPNGRIDFLSVDELARLEANSIAQFSAEDINAAIEEQNRVRQEQNPEQ